MSLTVQRDLDSLRAGLERWLGRAVGEIARPAPGWSCETLIVEDELVVRLPPSGDGIFPTYDLAQQAAVQEAVAGAGVPVAVPLRYEPDPSFLGAPFLTMPFVAGPIPGEFTAGDPWLLDLEDDSARADVWHAFHDAVGRVHAVPLASCTHLGLRAGLAAELDWWTDYITWATDGAAPPSLSDALDWCRTHEPVSEPRPSLLWGDVRYGNVIFDPGTRQPRAVLDWDMVSVGPAEMDVAWLVALEGVQQDLTGMTVPGFGDRSATVAAIEARLGRALSDLGWYEIFALVRASAVSTRIALLFQRAGRRTLFEIGEDPALAAARRRIESA
jgi:aminoglycoside phosphotransferase (APT) family kinase protein